MPPAPSTTVRSVWKKAVLAFAVALLGVFALASTAMAAPTNTVDPSFTGNAVNTSSTLTAVNGT